ncbi:DUF3560 domain-containing protein [Leucobacter sp. HY1908]
MLTITHTHEAGTIVEGTERGDGTAQLLKANGWRWGRSISAWYMPHSRDRLPKDYVITRTASALETAGYALALEVDRTTRSTGEVEASKAIRQANRADALEAKALRKSADAQQAWNRADAAGNPLPEGGEPIKIGHHSEQHHRNPIEKAHRRMGQAIAADADAEEAARRARVATATTSARYKPMTVANRIEKITADIRRALRAPVRRAARPARLLAADPRRPDRHRPGHQLQPRDRQERRRREDPRHLVTRAASQPQDRAHSG